MKSVPHSILLSVKPQYAEPIVKGLKRLEFRKKFSSKTTKNLKVYIYSSSPTKAIIGECKISKVLKLELKELRILWDRSGVDEGSFDSYFKNCNEGYAIFFDECQEYEKSVPLSFLKVNLMNPTLSYRFLNLEQSHIIEIFLGPGPELKFIK